MLKTTFILILLLASALLGFAWQEGTTCGTEHPTHAPYEHATKRALPACAIHECDDPSVRNLYLLTSQSPLITINMNIIYFGQLSGTAKTTYDAQIEFFRQEFRKHMNITFNINTTAVTDQYQTLNVSNGGLVFQVAGQYYVPGSLTVLLSVFSPNPQNLLGYSYLPQAIDLKTYPQHLFAAIDLARGISTRGTALLHETGHLLGLLHAFTEVSSATCGRCTENNNSTNLDSVGDYCSDTKPVSKSFYCNSLTQLNDCNNMPYPTDMSQLPQDNYMVYTPASCQTRFTPQQAARARCYLDRLISFVTAAPPSAPVAVQVPVGSPVSTSPIGSPLSTPIDTSVPQSASSPIAAPTTSGVVPSGSPVAKPTPTSSLMSLGARADIAAVLVGLVFFVVAM